LQIILLILTESFGMTTNVTERRLLEVSLTSRKGLTSMASLDYHAPQVSLGIA